MQDAAWKMFERETNFAASFNMNRKRELWNVKELNLGSEVRWHIWWWEIGVILCRFATWDHAIIQINLGPIIVLCQFHESNFCLLLLHFVADYHMCIFFDTARTSQFACWYNNFSIVDAWCEVSTVKDCCKFSQF